MESRRDLSSIRTSAQYFRITRFNVDSMRVKKYSLPFLFLHSCCIARIDLHVWKDIIKEAVERLFLLPILLETTCMFAFVAERISFSFNLLIHLIISLLINHRSTNIITRKIE